MLGRSGAALASLLVGAIPAVVDLVLAVPAVVDLLVDLLGNAACNGGASGATNVDDDDDAMVTEVRA